MKWCPKCKSQKPLEDFHKSSRSKDGRNGYCKECNIKQRMDRYEHKKEKIIKTDSRKQCRICKEIKEYSYFKNKKNTYCDQCVKFIGNVRVLKRYKLTPESYKSMLDSQSGVCKICNFPEKDGRRLSVDHDHSCCSGTTSCGKCIRGLLCSRCNKTLGMIKDDQDLLLTMIEYLQNY